MDLKNAAVLVTGGSCGIGFETARLLRQRGARVAICARHEDMLESAAKEIDALPIIAARISVATTPARNTHGTFS